ncbi:MAG: S-layer homology domain-containing protein [Peptococcaceae bacterium]|nr:S-layer homology domain-containing protein [Candidatus Syntrophopropionicum ammoniitolerans]
MRTRIFSRRWILVAILVCSLTGLMLVGVLDRVEATPQLTEQAVKYIKNEFAEYGVVNVDMGVGSYAFFVLAAGGVDVSAWRHEGIGFKEALSDAIKSDIARADQVSAKRLAHDLAAAKALGQQNLVEQLLLLLKNRQSDAGFDQIGPLSIYSNMPALETLSRLDLLEKLDCGLAKDYILDQRYSGTEDRHRGSWGSVDNGHFYPDFMAVTAAVRMLSRMDPSGNDAELQQTITNGLDWLKRQQQPAGNFMAGMDDTLIDTCDLIITLKELEMDPATWLSSAGTSPVDYLYSEALNADGSFGQSQNVMDATLVLWACKVLEDQPSAQPKPDAEKEHPVQPEPGAKEEQPVPTGPQEQPAPVEQVVQSQPFNDITNHWARESIALMAEKGITAGYDDGSFRPDAQVTRSEIATMLVRLLQPQAASAQDLQFVKESFADAGDIPDWALADVAAALREGLVSGYPQGDGASNFAGSRDVNRAELAVMMGRIVEMKLGQVQQGPLDFADNDLIPDWAQSSINIVSAVGIAGGYPDQTFRAGQPVTRAEAASMMGRLIAQIPGN